MRRVKYYEYEKAGNVFDRVLKGDATFHQFGVDYEEFETGPGNFSTAIIELPDGTIKNIPVELIEFDTESWKVEAKELCDSGKFIAAIKLCRESTGMSLKDARWAVESLL